MARDGSKQVATHVVFAATTKYSPLFGHFRSLEVLVPLYQFYSAIESFLDPHTADPDRPGPRWRGQEGRRADHYPPAINHPRKRCAEFSAEYYNLKK